MERQYTLILSALAFLVLCTSIGYGWLYSTYSGLPFILGAAVMPALVLLLTITTRNDTDIFSPLYLVLYLMVLSVFIKTAYFLYFDSELAIILSLDGRDFSILYGGIAATTLGVLAFVAGYVVTMKNTTSRRYRRSSNMGFRQNLASRVRYNSGGFILFLLASNAVFIVCFYVFATELDLFSQIRSGVISSKRVHEVTADTVRGGSAQGYMRWGATTLPQIVVLTTVAARWVTGIRFSKPTFFLLLSLAFGSMLIPILASARLELVYFVLMLSMLSHYYRKSLSARKLAVLGLALFSIIAILGEIRNATTSRVGYSLNAESVITKIIGGAYFVDVGKTSVVVDSVPYSVDYQYGKTLGLFILAPIPRSIWPDKPAVRLGAFIGNEIFNRVDSAGIPPGFIAESYLNFGYLGIAALLPIVGMLCALLYKRNIVYPTHPLAPLWYVVGVVILTLSLLSGDLTLAVSQTIRYGLIIFVVSFALFARQPIQSQRNSRRHASRRPQSRGDSRGNPHPLSG